MSWGTVARCGFVPQQPIPIWPRPSILQRPLQFCCSVTFIRGETSGCHLQLSEFSFSFCHFSVLPGTASCYAPFLPWKFSDFNSCNPGPTENKPPASFTRRVGQWSGLVMCEATVVQAGDVSSQWSQIEVCKCTGSSLGV